LIAYTIGSVYGMYRAKRMLGITFDLKDLSKIYLVSFLSIIPSILIVTNLVGIQKILLGTGLYLFIYMTLIPAFRIISANEIKMINNIIQKTKTLYLFKLLIWYVSKILQLS